MKTPLLMVVLIALSIRQVMAQPAALAAAEALKALHSPKDLKIELVLNEPRIEQPVFLNFDHRGRMWVVEYRQYPHPAGLKIVSTDQYFRNVYDRVSPAPPNHFRGKDRISIHEDTNGDGVFDKSKVFVDELNMATSVTLGRGGAWVLQPPYLLFYPDANGDDIPDGAPVTHLKGFWLEDTHSIANSLRWGPDGWLYGCQGSTVSSDIEIVGKTDGKPLHSLGQLIWRYHPAERRFEIWAEGGGNAFGLEIDRKGRIFSGHNGGDTRGFHYPQHGYLRKGFTKHGPLSNPYAFGFFPHMPHNKVARFTHNFVIYEGTSLPKRYHGHLFGVDPMNKNVPISEFKADGATFRTKDISHAITGPTIRGSDQSISSMDRMIPSMFATGTISNYPTQRTIAVMLICDVDASIALRRLTQNQFRWTISPPGQTMRLSNPFDMKAVGTARPPNESLGIAMMQVSPNR